MVVTGRAEIDECLVGLGLLVSEEPSEFGGICCGKFPEFFPGPSDVRMRLLWPRVT